MFRVGRIPSFAESLSVMRKPRVQQLLLIPVILVAGWLLSMFALAWTAKRPATLGIQAGRLAECPQSPNCVCTQSASREHWIEPLTLATGGEPSEEWNRLGRVVREMSGATVVTETEDYRHVEFRTPFFGFVDDVELFLAPESSRVHFRSASRVGYSDLGLNRKRMEELRRRFSESSDATSAGQNPNP